MLDVSTATANYYLPYLNAAMAEGEINSPARQAAFLAQLATTRMRGTSTPSPTG